MDIGNQQRVIIVEPIDVNEVLAEEQDTDTSVRIGPSPQVDSASRNGSTEVQAG